MASIRVLSDTLKANMLETSSAPKGKDVVNSPENVAAVFAAMLSGSMNPNVDPKGQNFEAGQELEDNPSAAKTVHRAQNQNRWFSMLEYSNSTLPFLTQPMLQRDFPAGKEAKFGNDVTQETENLTDANSGTNFGLAMLDLFLQGSDEVSAQSGMTKPKPQGDNLEITDLDKYKIAIRDLLEKLSGGITDLSPKGNQLGNESTGTMDISYNEIRPLLEAIAAGIEVANNIEVVNQYSGDLMPDRESLQFSGNRPQVLRALDMQLSPADLLEIKKNTKVGLASTPSDFLVPNVDSNIQNSSITGQDSEEKLSTSTEAPVQSVQNQNPSVNMLGYGSFMLPILPQPMSQSNLPTGKAVYSGKDVGQVAENSSTTISGGTDDTVVARNNLGSAELNQLSQASDDVFAQLRITKPKPQGDNVGILELDKYKQVVAGLLEALSGEITYSSSKENLSIDTITRNLSQDVAKIIQSWTSATDEDANNIYAFNDNVRDGQVPSPNINSLNSESSELKVTRQDVANIVRSLMSVTDEATKEPHTLSDNVTVGQIMGGVEGATLHKGNEKRTNPSLTQLTDTFEALIKEIGEGKFPSPNINSVNSEGSEPKVTRQDVANVVRSLMSVTDEATKEPYTLSGNVKVSQIMGGVEGAKTLPEGNEKRATSSLTQMIDPLVALIKEMGEGKAPSPNINSVNSESSEPEITRQDVANIVRNLMSVTDEATKEPHTLSDNVTVGQIMGGVEGAKTLPEGNEKRATLSSTQAIDDLEALFREIRKSAAPSPKVNPESPEPKVTRQDMVKIVQGWMTATNEDTKNGQVSGSQKGFQTLLNGLIAGIYTGNPEFKAEAARQSAELNPFLSQGAKDLKVPQETNETIEVEGNVLAFEVKGSSVESSIKSLNGLDRVSLQESNNSKSLLKSSNEELQKINSFHSSEQYKVKDMQTSNSSADIGFVSNILTTNVGDGKTVAIPVWEQISRAFREQITNRHQELKELDIQLHPADLGKIQIAVRWENGLVHLQVQASEAATGQLLQNQLSDLRQNLTNHGINCGSLQMGQGGEQQQNPQGNEQKRTFAHNMNPIEEEVFSPVTNPFSPEKDVTRINVTA